MAPGDDDAHAGVAGANAVAEAVPEAPVAAEPVAAEPPIVWESVHVDVAPHLEKDRDIGAALERAVSVTEDWGAEQLVALHAALCAARHAASSLPGPLALAKAKHSVLALLPK